jgi:pyruvate dehydrogenase E1 component alpha subunit
MTYRFFGHAMGDSMGYMPRAELEAARAADPVLKLRQSLIDAGTCTEGDLAEIEADLRKEVDEAFEYAMSAPLPDVSEATTDVYAEGVAL